MLNVNMILSDEKNEMYLQTVHLNTTQGVPVKIAVKDSFHSPNELAPR